MCLNNITDIDKDLKEKYENRIIEIEQELDKISNDENRDFRPAQKLAQSKLLKALKISSEKILSNKASDSLIKEAERLAPRFYLLPFYKALIEMNKTGYEYSVVKQYFVESLSSYPDDPRVLFEYARLLKKHKKESSKEYAPIFYKAFQLGKNIGYGIEAGVSYFDNEDYWLVFEIIQKIKEIEPSFPKDIQHKLWTSKTILKLAEDQMLKDTTKSIELLNSIENSIDTLAQEKTKDCRMLKAKFCSLLALTYALSDEPMKSRQFLSSTMEIINIYKSVSNNLIEMKELLCYNFAIEAIICKEHAGKLDKFKKLENEISGIHQKQLLIKFSPFLKLIKHLMLTGF